MKKALSIMLSLLLLAAMLVTVSAAGTGEFVYLTVEKFTVGQGYILEPTKVELQEGDTAWSVFARVIGEDNIVTTTSDWGSYLSGVKDNASEEATIPQFILDQMADIKLTGRADADILAAYDYDPQSGWNYAVNNAAASVGMESYKPVAGDVIRVMYSVYGYGTDIGFGYDAATQKSDGSYIEVADRDALIKLIADTVPGDNEALKDALDNAIAVSSDLSSSQTVIDKAVSDITAVLAGTSTNESIDTASVMETLGSDTPDTSDTSAVIFAVMLSASAVSVFVLNRTKRDTEY